MIDVNTSLENQKLACDVLSHVWLSASAGSGKTKVLVDRILNLLLHGKNPDSILCLTYTNAAALEMESRVRDIITSWSLMSRDELIHDLTSRFGAVNDEKIKHASSLYLLAFSTDNFVHIQTIHGFCSKILKRFSLEAGVAPYFKMLDDDVDKELFQKAWQKTFLELQDYESSFSQVTSYVSLAFFDDLFNSLKKYSDTLSKWSESSFKHYQNFFLLYDADLKDDLKACFIEKTNQDCLRQVFDSLRKSSGKTDQSNADILGSFLKKPNEYLDSYANIFLKKDGDIKGKIVSQDFKKTYPLLSDFLDVEAKRVFDFYDCLKRKEAYLANISLTKIAHLLFSNYNLLKKQKGVLDFDDLIKKTLLLLNNNDVSQWIAYQLDQKIDHILLDEGQDTSPEQWQILLMFLQEFFVKDEYQNLAKTFFVVGDFKQSIYSFQGARPELFGRVKELLCEKAKLLNIPFKDLDLNLSFRSSSHILNFVDCVFNRIESNQKRGFDHHLKHYAWRKDEGSVTLWPLIISQSDNDDDDDLPHSKVELAKKIASHIAHLLNQGVYLESKKRNLLPEDIFILLQKRGTFAHILTSQLKRLHINVASLDRIILNDQLVVKDLLSLLRFILDESDDLALAEVLKSPLFDHSDDDLLRVSSCNNQSLWQKINASTAKEKHFEKTILILDELKENLSSPFEFFYNLLEKKGFRYNFCKRLGDQVNDLLDEFLIQALLFEETNASTLQGFYLWFSSKEIIVKRQNSSRNKGVSIMTVHASKGLQAPFVILPDTVDVNDLKDKILPLVTDDEQIALPLWLMRSQNHTTSIKRLIDVERESRRQESLRLLYVALTRAQDHLLICGAQGKRSRSSDSWYALCDQILEPSKGLFEVGRAYSTAGSLQKVGDTTVEKEDKNLNDESGDFFDVPQAFLSSEFLSQQNATTKHCLSKSECFSSHISALDYGTILHRLLGAAIQLKGKLPAVLFESMTDFCDELTKKTLLERVNLVLENVFLKDSYEGSNVFSEVTLIGMYQSKKVTVQIDALFEFDHEIRIVDFKTDREVPAVLDDINPSYIEQIKIYTALVQKQFPQKKVRSFLFWCQSSHVFELPEDLFYEQQYANY